MKQAGKVLMCIALILVLLLSGCQKEDVQAVESNTHIVTAKESETVTIIDSAGREVTVPKNPQRVAALYAVSGHIITMLDRGETIVAVNNGLKRDVLLNQLEPGIANAIMAVKSGQINMESLLESGAEIAFIPLDVYHDTQQTDQLETFDIPYVVVDFQSIEAQKDGVTFIGEILDAKAEAKAFVAIYDEVIGELSDDLSGLEADERINVYHSINEANCTVSKNTLAAEWMAIAGGRDVSLDGDLEKDGDKYYTNLEQIIAWNPQIIFCNEAGVSDYILGNPTWQFIDAVKTKAVYQMPVGISRWGHKTSIETPLAMLWVAHQLYPDKVPDLTRAYADSFYQTLFQFELSDEMYEAILSGDEMRLPKE